MPFKHGPKDSHFVPATALETSEFLTTTILAEEGSDGRGFLRGLNWFAEKPWQGKGETR